jgi:hypothetical protein
MTRSSLQASPILRACRPEFRRSWSDAARRAAALVTGAVKKIRTVVVVRSMARVENGEIAA